jgi:rhomboid family GlyGly-CTERM serine protease
VFFVGAFAVSAGMLAFNPSLRWYVGLSGVLHGFFIAGCLADMHKTFRWDNALLFGLVTVKLIYEQIWGPLPGSEETAGGNVISDAHLYGALAGLFVYVGFWFHDRIKSVPAK